MTPSPSASGSCCATATCGTPSPAASSSPTRERWRVDDRIRRLNALGFDVDELAITTDIGGTSIQIQPKVVDAGHHSRRLLRLTGLDVRENQARRLLNDLDAYTRRDRSAGGGRGDRRPRLAVHRLRAGDQPSAACPRLEARAGRGLPRGARAPLVHGRARPARHPDRGRRSTTTSPRCCPASPTSGRCSGSTRVSYPSSPLRRGEPRIEGHPPRFRQGVVMTDLPHDPAEPTPDQPVAPPPPPPAAPTASARRGRLRRPRLLRHPRLRSPRRAPPPAVRCACDASARRASRVARRTPFGTARSPGAARRTRRSPVYPAQPGYPPQAAANPYGGYSQAPVYAGGGGPPTRAASPTSSRTSGRWRASASARSPTSSTRP